MGRTFSFQGTFASCRFVLSAGDGCASAVAPSVILLLLPQINRRWPFIFGESGDDGWRTSSGGKNQRPATTVHARSSLPSCRQRVFIDMGSFTHRDLSASSGPGFFAQLLAGFIRARIFTPGAGLPPSSVRRLSFDIAEICVAAILILTSTTGAGQRRRRKSATPGLSFCLFANRHRFAVAVRAGGRLPFNVGFYPRTPNLIASVPVTSVTTNQCRKVFCARDWRVQAFAFTVRRIDVSAADWHVPPPSLSAFGHFAGHLRPFLQRYVRRQDRIDYRSRRIIAKERCG